MDSVADLWPPFSLVIETDRLELRLPREDELAGLARAARVIASPGEPRLHLEWMYEPSPGMERKFVQRYWRALAHWRPGSWHLPLGVFLGGTPVGVQDMWANDFAHARSVGTGSWISRPQQGHGYGTEARAAVLELAFGWLGAEEACTEYLDGNAASEQVSRKLGYRDNAGFGDDEPSVDCGEVGVDLVGVQAEPESGSFQAQAGGCAFVGLLCHVRFLLVRVF